MDSQLAKLYSCVSTDYLYNARFVRNIYYSKLGALSERLPLSHVSLGPSSFFHSQHYQITDIHLSYTDL